MTVKQKWVAREKLQTFDVSAPYLTEGRLNVPLGATDNMWLTLKVNAEGGENATHTHLDEDHFFIVLEGEVTFYDKDDRPTVLEAYQGIMIPRGAYYRYLNTGNGNLFLLRCGCAVDNPEGVRRLDPEGNPLVGSSKENKHIEGVIAPGKEFGRSSG